MSDDRIIPVIMPKWGMSMTEGKLTDWLVDEGTEISVGDEIMEVETDKITNVVEAADAGVLRRRVAVEGTTHPIRALLGVLAAAEVSDDEVSAFVEAFEAPETSGGDDADDGSQYQFADTKAGRLRYAVRGEGETAIVLIHGFGGDLDNWLFNIDALADNATVYALDLPGGRVEVTGEIAVDGTLRAVLDGRRVSAAIVRQGRDMIVILGGVNHRLWLDNPLDAAADEQAYGGRMTAPMPGKVVKVHVSPGQDVADGAALIVLEAMKMEHTIAAPSAGRVAAVYYAAGDVVEEGVELLTLDTAPRA